MTTFVIRLVRWLMKRPLSLHERSFLMTVLLDGMGGLPFSAPIQFSETGLVLINGKELDLEQARAIQEGARTALRNPAVKLMWDHTAYLATENGVHKAENELQMLWGRTALWNGQQEKKLLKELAGTSQ